MFAEITLSEMDWSVRSADYRRMESCRDTMFEMLNTVRFLRWNIKVVDIFFDWTGITCDKNIAETCRRQRQATLTPASKKFSRVAGTKYNWDVLSPLNHSKSCGEFAKNLKSELGSWERLEERSLLLHNRCDKISWHCLYNVIFCYTAARSRHDIGYDGQCKKTVRNSVFKFKVPFPAGVSSCRISLQLQFGHISHLSSREAWVFVFNTLYYLPPSTLSWGGGGICIQTNR